MADLFDKGWVRRRVEELRAGGMPRTKARAYARAEAKGRRRVARLTGVPAAEAAEITIEDGRPTILIDSTLIPPVRRDAVRRFLFGPIGSIQ